ncbi:FHIPEP family type III secretion protein [Escherichia coli]
MALGRAIPQQWFPGKDKVHVIGLDTPLERLFYRRCRRGRTGARAGGSFTGANSGSAIPSGDAGAPPVLLVNHALRPFLSRFLRRSLPQCVVLSKLELSDNRHIRMTATIRGK